jgi:hypothetical protein
MSLFFGLLFGSIGGVYIVYGKRTTSLPYLICGVLLAVYPYFFDSAWAVALIGVMLIAAPVVIARGLI